MSLLFRKLGHNNIRTTIFRHETQVIVVTCRKLSVVPSLYDGEQDPAPKFFSPNVQVLLKRLTRPDYNKVFRKRTNSGYSILKTPTYKFLTNEELEAQISEANKTAERLLQMPPVVKTHTPINDVISKDPALVGLETATHLFTDITFGVDNQHRIIVQRLPNLISEHRHIKDEHTSGFVFDSTGGQKNLSEQDPDGTLRSCDHDTRKRLNQVYFPMNGRNIREPLMFSDQEKLTSLLDREKYEFVLDRACIQYEPDEPSYQRITSITYQHVDAAMKFDLLRSTRHFGPLTFYLVWHQTIDNLMLELLQGGAAREAVLLAALRQAVHGGVGSGDLTGISQQILKTPVQLTRPEQLTEEDIALDNKCIECIEQYIKMNSAMKSKQELALQGFREHYQQLVELSRGLQKAHGKM